MNLAIGQNYFVKNVDFRSIGHAESAGIQSFEAYSADHDALKSYLSAAAMQFSGEDGIELVLPVMDLGLQSFIFHESPCMMPGISAKYPFIKSYKGFAVNDPSINCRIDFGTQGMHGAIKTNNGTVYIDPVEGGERANYIFYYTKDQVVESGQVAACGHDPRDTSPVDHVDLDMEVSSRSGEAIPLTTYRIAIATTGEFGETLGETVENSLSFINTAVGRLNMIFENELALKFVLVDDNDKLLNFDSDTDAFFDGRSTGANDTDPGPGLLSENPIFVNNAIGFGSYDIGHIFTRGCYGVGGVANLGSLCGPVNRRASGVTCWGSSNPNIEAVTVSILSHEVGHQMSAQHSFNRCSDNANVNSGTGYEPGSGITIMSYAGVCDNASNLASTNYDVYHVGSLNQIYNFTRVGNGTTCGVKEELGNHEPDVSLEYEDGFYIPISTPFELSGEAFDSENDVMTYTWEQYNTSAPADLGSPFGNSPSFRNYYPDTAKTRYFPVLQNTLNGTSNKREVLPTYSRDLDFRFVARDNHINGGTASWEHVSFHATDMAGPFRVLTQDVTTSYAVGERVLIQWDVANTDVAPVNAKTVDIYISTNGGYDLDHTLMIKTLNDGEEYVYIPDALTNEARIKIKASENIFFDYNDTDFSIVEASQAGYFFNLENSAYDVCVPTLVSIPVEGVSYGGYDEQVEYSIIEGLPNNVSYEFSDNNIPAGSSTSLELDFSQTIFNDFLTLQIQAVSTSNDTIVRTLTLDVTTTDYSEIANVTPVNGSSGNPVTPYFEWVGSSNADSYTIQLSTSAKFEEDETQTISNIEDVSVAYEELLEKNTIYYWRILGENKCGTADYGEIFAFSTISESCASYNSSDLPINISQSGMPTVESKIFITDQGQASDVNVAIKGAHSYISQLDGYLVSPSGTEARMFGNNCFNLSNFNCGFDDESAFEIGCPLTGGQVFRPQQDLAVFKGEEIEGEWTFRIEDTDGGDGGKFEIFELNLCSSTSLESPYIKNNNPLLVNDNERRNIGESLLRALHPTVESGDLIFTIIKTPDIGTLLLENVPVTVGDQFTQADIDATRLDYRHEGENLSTDNFLFTVVDGQGGWIEPTAYNIEVVSFTATEEPEDVTDVFTVFPNPTDSKIILRSENYAQNYNVQILDAQGKLIYDGERSGSSSEINMRAFSDGIYILKIENKDIRQVVKVIKN